MHEEGDAQFDSDVEFEKPKDEFMFYFKAFKIEEKKMYQHQKFEEITGKYWQLLRSDNDCDISQPYILQPLYTKFMKSVYKTLLPLFRENEINSELLQEWIQDSRGQPGLNFSLLTKVLFKIAHHWATNIDLEEYIDLLNKIFNRITCQYNTIDNGDLQKRDYSYIIEFPQDEKKIHDLGGKIEKQAQFDEWLECRSDESNRSEFEYKYEEDPENMMVKKYKKSKLDANGMATGPQMTIKEPFIYSEEIKYQYYEGYDLIESYQIRELSQIVPFGFPTEAFLCLLKNDIFTLIQTKKEENKQEIARLKREARDQGKEVDLSSYQNEDDPGLVYNPSNEVKERTFSINLPSYPTLSINVKISDQLYNSFRQMMRDAQNMCLRMHSLFPKPGARSKTRSSLQGNDPITEINKFGYNPALERRVSYKLNPIVAENSVSQFVNINFMIWNERDYMVYRSDVQKVETKSKMSIKETDEIKKEEEFVNVETSYKRVRDIMLSKKFGSIFADRSNSDNKEQKRLKKIVEREEKRKAGIMKPGLIASKGLQETFEEKTFIKMMKGPFFQLQSREGMKEDNFVHCSDLDIIESANTFAMRILIIGKPRSGKTTLAKNIALKNNLDIVHINVDNWILALLEKIRVFNEEVQEEAEEQAEPIKYFTDLEEEVKETLKQGSGPSDDQIIEIIKQQINSPQSRTRGFVVDLHYYQRYQSWSSTIRQQGLLPSVDGTQQEFSHIIELVIDDEEIKLRAQNMRVNPVDNVVYSRWEREERKKPKIIPEGEEENQEDEENTVKPLDESTLIHRIQDQESKIKEEITYYNTIERPAVEELLINLYDNQYFRIDCAGLNPDEITNCALCRIKYDKDLPLRPVAIQIEGGNDFKSLLTEGLEENVIPRKWSLYKQIDPVALYDGKLVQGSTEFAAHFHNNVFTFISEENMKRFILEPKLYINKPPQMPSIYRTLMLGPQGTGKHTQAQQLSNKYGWQIVDFKQMIRQKIDEMLKFEIHIPNNPLPGGRIGLSETELQEIAEGKPFSAWKFIPWIFDYLGFELEKKRPPPPEQKEGEEQNEEEEINEEDLKKKKEQDAKKKKEEDEKKRKEEEEINKLKEERRRRRQEAIDQGLDLAELGLENEDEEIIIIEDLPADKLALKIDENTQKPPFVGGFILIGFPETEEQFTKLKEYGLEFDRVIYLQDTNEDDPGKEIKDRMASEDNYEYEWEVENSQKILALAKDQLGDDIVKEISCNGTVDEVFIRIMNEIDPFYLKIDNPDDVRMSADLSEEDKKLAKGDFGDYCPVTYVKDNWLVRGNPEIEVTIGGKTYWPAGEKEAEEFKFNPSKFLQAQKGFVSLPLEAPPPKIMILGHKGAGVTTLIQNLCNKYKLEELNLKEVYLQKLKDEKEKRKRKRLLDRGFKPPLPPEEEGMDSPPDPEIEDDPEDFDKQAHERDVIKTIMDSKKSYVIDGTWSDLPEESVSQSLNDLLFESRRVPEIVIMLKCKEKSTFDRIIDYKSIQYEFDNLMQKREEERKRVRQEDMLKKIEDLNADEEKPQEEKDEEMIKWNEDRDAEDEAADENDPEKPNLDEMKEKFREQLRERREKDEAFMEEFGNQLKEKFVFVIDDIKTDISAQFVFLKILDRIKDNFQYRKDLIDRQLAQILKPEEVKFYEQSYNSKYSKFGLNSPINISNPQKSKSFGVLYRERLYFLTNKEEQQIFLKEPSKYAFNNDTIPLDVQYKSKICVIGYSKIGKSTLCKKLKEKVGVIHLHMPSIIQSFLDKDSLYFDNVRKTLQVEGKQLEDDMLVNLLLKRLQYEDCQRNGWVLEDFPKTRNQALLMAKKGLVPTNIFYLKLEKNESIIRNLKRDPMKFGSKISVMISRIKFIDSNLPNLLSFYQKYYNNVSEIDMQKSKWYVEDKAISDIKNNLEGRQQFARDYFLNTQYPQPCKMKNLHMDKCLTKQTISEFKYYCPVTWRNDKILVNCCQNFEDTLLYKNFFFFFKSQKERDMFFSNPERFLLNSNFPKFQDIPIRIMPHKAAEIISLEKALLGHCASTLIDEERVQKGDSILVVHYKDQKYCFDNEFKLQRFLANPFKYSKAILPVKMPPNQDKISLYNLSKMEDSITFMEQSLGQIVTRALREVSENRLKYPSISVKETMLKLFALFLKTNNPANTQFMKKKYEEKMKQFIQRCEIPEEIYDLSQEKEKYYSKGNKEGWSQFKEDYYNKIGAKYDSNNGQIHQEKLENFISYIR